MRGLGLGTNDLSDLGRPLLSGAARTLRGLVRIQERIGQLIGAKNRTSGAQSVTPRLVILIGQTSRQASRQVSLHLDVRGGLAAQSTHDASAQPRHKTRDRTRHIPGTEYLGNTGAYFPAQDVVARGGGDLTRARRDRLFDPFDCLFVCAIVLTSSIESTEGLRQRRRHSPGQRTANNRSPLRGIPTNCFQERANGGHRVDRQTTIRQRLLVDRHDRNVSQASALCERSQVGANFVGCARGHTVQHDCDTQAAACGILEVLPCDGIGIARCTRHEHPQVRTIEKFRSETTVAVLHRINVGGVQDAETRPQRVIDSNSDGVEAFSPVTGMLGKTRQHPIGHEPRPRLR